MSAFEVNIIHSEYLKILYNVSNKLESLCWQHESLLHIENVYRCSLLSQKLLCAFVRNLS